MSASSFFFIVAATSISVSTPNPLPARAARVRWSTSSKLAAVIVRLIVYVMAVSKGCFRSGANQFKKHPTIFIGHHQRVFAIAALLAFATA